MNLRRRNNYQKKLSNNTNTPPKCGVKSRKPQMCNNQPSTAPVDVSRTSSDDSVIYVGCYLPVCPFIDLTNSSTSLQDVNGNVSSTPRHKKVSLRKQINSTPSKVGERSNAATSTGGCEGTEQVVGSFGDASGDLLDKIVDWQEAMSDLSDAELDCFSLGEKESSVSIAELMEEYDVHPDDTFK